MDNSHVFFFRSSNPFSNWFTSVFVIEDRTFMNNEQWMMYSKAVLFKDSETALEIMKNSDPKTCKALGRKVKNFDCKVWDENCMKIVSQGLFAKFTQNKILKQILLDTEDKNIVEASPYDRIWGIGLSESDAKRTHPNTWPGLNKLGICLMNVRELIKH